MRTYDGYSAKVALTLYIHGQVLALSHVGPGGVIVQDECDPIASGDAELVIKVNDSESKHKIFLPHGISGPQQLSLFL
jgi:hypothetical protein